MSDSNRQDEEESLPGCSYDPPNDNSENQQLLNSPDSFKSVAISESAPSTFTGGTVRRTRSLTRFNPFSLLDKICACTFYELSGKERNKICSVCGPNRRNYRRISNIEDVVNVANVANVANVPNVESTPVLVKFYVSPRIADNTALLLQETSTASDACKMLSKSGRTHKFFDLAIYEHAYSYHSERLLEDHEIILHVQSQQKRLESEKFAFISTIDIDKYHYCIKKEEYFIHPRALMGLDYTKLKCDPKYIQIKDLFLTNQRSDIRSSSPDDPEGELKKEYLCESHNPIFCGTVYALNITGKNKEKILFKRRKFRIRKWTQQFLLLRNRNVYVVHSFKEMINLYYMSDEDFSIYLKAKNMPSKIRCMGSVLDMEFYSHLNIRLHERDAPHGSGIVIRKFTPNQNTCLTILLCLKPSETPNFRRQQWLVALKLAKHGKRLKENYKIYEHERELYQIGREKHKKEIMKKLDLDPAGTEKRVKQEELITQVMAAYIDRYHTKEHKPEETLFSEACALPESSSKHNLGKTDTLSEDIPENPWTGIMDEIFEFLDKYNEEDFMAKDELPKWDERTADNEETLLKKIPPTVEEMRNNMANFALLKKLKLLFDREMKKRDEVMFMREEEASNPRVAMDFTDGVGRIVHDPEEVRAIAESERYHVSRNSRYMQCNDNEKFEILTSGEHIKQRYYHGNLTRAAAGKLVVKNGKDGAFLVRESHNRPGWLVITYFWCGKAHHQYIRPVILPDSDKKTGIYLATCDAETVFYDVHSLLEFYRLNKGPLYTRLSESIKNQSQPNRTPPRERKTILAGVDFKPWFMKPQSTLSQAEDQAQSQAQASTSTADPSQPQTPQSSQNLQSFSLNVPPTDTVSTSPENNRSTDEAQTQTAPTQTQGDKPSPEI